MGLLDQTYIFHPEDRGSMYCQNVDNTAHLHGPKTQEHNQYEHWTTTNAKISKYLNLINIKKQL
jgi:hypothetical protein